METYAARGGEDEAGLNLFGGAPPVACGAHIRRIAGSLRPMRRSLLMLTIGAVVACGGTTVTEPETTTTAPTVETTTTSEVTASSVAGSSPTLAITIASFRFSGDATGVVGDTVQVTNADGFGHTWTDTDGAFHSGVIAANESFVFTFEEAGTFDFFCQIHPEMTGSITIDG